MICGIDEAGRGPVIGPMVIAGVRVENEKEIARLGVKDSKRHTPAARRRLADEIKRVADIEIEIVPPSVIDALREDKSLNEIEKEYFIKIMKRLEAEIYYVDAIDVEESRLSRELADRLPFKAKVIAKHRADSLYPVVSAASVIAKTRRDEEIEKIAKELEPRIGLPLGSGYPADPVTMNFLEEWFRVYGSFPPHVRRTWKTLKKFYNKRLL